MKIALGTVQFGLKYGINNTQGKVEPQAVKDILTYAHEHGVKTLDTAYDYGDSEAVIGEVMANNQYPFDVITKLPSCDADHAQQFFNTSLDRLRVTSVAGLLVHHMESYRRDKALWPVVNRLKASGRVAKIGFSLYYPSDLEELFSQGVKFDLVQVPFSIFDRRFEPYFDHLKERGVEVHVRSVFLQGLMFRDPGLLTGKFSSIALKVRALQDFAREKRVPLSALAINTAVLQPAIDRVVIGIDSLGHLKEMLSSQVYREETRAVLAGLNQFKEDDEQVILPVNWSR